MDVSRLLSILKRELSGRHGEDLIAFQNHLYGCFIVMEDITQGILEVVDRDYIVGNALYLNTRTQFGQIGIRYYGFTMDGKAVLKGDLVTGDYYEAWMTIFHETAQSRQMDSVDRVEDEVIQVMTGFRKDENYFMNALEHEGNLSPDWVEKTIYVFHPHLEVLNDKKERQEREESQEREKEKEESQEKEERVGKREGHTKDKKRIRGFSLTRRRVRQMDHTRLSTTRRHMAGVKK